MLVLFTSLYVPELMISAVFGSQVFIQPNGCDKSISNSGDGQLLDPDISFPGNRSDSPYVTPYENCTEDLTATLFTAISHTTILFETRNYSIDQVQNVTNVTLKTEFEGVSNWIQYHSSVCHSPDIVPCECF